VYRLLNQENLRICLSVAEKNSSQSGSSHVRAIRTESRCQPGELGETAEIEAISRQDGATEVYSEGQWKDEAVRNTALEDRLLQVAVAQVLMAIYEEHQKGEPTRAPCLIVKLPGLLSSTRGLIAGDGVEI
jgi:hypothetical protein